jgi:hypothetical protein
MKVMKICDGLWRWTAPHPAWTPADDRPDGWPQEVGCVYFEGPEGIVLCDPLVPSDAVEAERFWTALDRDVAKIGRDMTVLVGTDAHGRSADAVRDRYGHQGVRVAVIGAAAFREVVSCRLTATLEEAGPPAGVRAFPVAGFIPGETAWMLDGPRAAVFADAVLGAGDGRVRLAPPSWGVKTPEGQAAYVLEAGPEILLPSHGAPVLSDGTAALAAAIAEKSSRS